ncbi:MAG: YceI family protein [Pseudomonadota bacterium]
MRALPLLTGLLALFGLAACAEADSGASWRLVDDDSRISFVSIKAGDVAESHYFTEIDGSVGPDGAAAVEIALASVETKVDIRNERMRDLLFETEQFPTAAIAAQIDLETIASLAVGERALETVDLTLSIHGADVVAPAALFVTRLGDDRVSVETVEPVLLFAEDFGLGDGVAKLREIAGLPSISLAVPVTASLVFER